MSYRAAQGWLAEVYSHMQLQNILIAILYNLVNDEFKGKDITELIMRTQEDRLKDKLLINQK